MRIAFVVPEVAPRLIGGAITVYRYADGLAGRGHSVTIVHPEQSLLTDLRDRIDRDPILGPRNGASESAAIRAFIDGEPVRWYRFSFFVSTILIPDIGDWYEEGRYDVCVVTHREVLERIRRMGDSPCSMVYWLVDFESYLLGSRIRQRVTRRSLDVKWPIIVNAKAAATLVRNTTGRDSWLLPRSLRSEEFRMIRPVLDSGRHLLGFPARTEITKRSVDAIRAMHIVRDRITKGHVSFWCYGYEKIACLPSWIEHFVAPSDSELIELLNRTAVFMVSSEYEGYGQPGAEAMACGAALVSTRNGGVDMYAVDRSSALLCPAHSPQCLADGVLELMANDELRSAIATNGIERATAVSWSTTLAEFERFLQLAANSVSAP